MTAPDPALDVESLTKNFGALTAVDDVTLDVERGEIVGVAGPNGAGKTTLYNLLSGFLRPSTGRIVINGTDATGRTPQEIVDLGLVRSFQGTRLVTTLTVLENIMVAAMYARGLNRQDGRTYAKEVAEQFDLKHLLRDPAADLNLFQSKQLVFARLFATGADILLFDEPFAGLNQEEIDELIPIIETMWQQDKTILIIEHNFDSLVTFVQRVVILNEGKVLADEAAEVISDNPKVKEVYLGG